MTRVYLADGQPAARSALCLMLRALEMQVVGEAADWPTAMAQAPATRPDLLLLDSDLIRTESGTTLFDLRLACPTAVVVVLIGPLEASQRAARSIVADYFISKGESADRVADCLLAAAGRGAP